MRRGLGCASGCSALSLALAMYVNVAGCTEWHSSAEQAGVHEQALAVSIPAAGECHKWADAHDEWIFCDDFETRGALVGSGRYFEYVDDGGDFVPLDGVGLDDSRGMRVRFQEGEVRAGNLKLGFGRNPSRAMNQGHHPGEDFREVYYRLFLKTEKGWQGNPDKLTRATVIASDNWSQAMIAHFWGGSENRVLMDPVRCVDLSNRVVCNGYNDFDSMDWLGQVNGKTPLFAPGRNGRWACIEAHVRLNDPGRDNGIQEFWIDGELEASRRDLNFVSGYTEYGINAIFFENYWNTGSIRDQERYLDNIVVSRERIGCSVGHA